MFLPTWGQCPGGAGLGAPQISSLCPALCASGQGGGGGHTCDSTAKIWVQVASQSAQAALTARGEAQTTDMYLRRCGGQVPAPWGSERTPPFFQGLPRVERTQRGLLQVLLLLPMRGESRPEGPPSWPHLPLMVSDALPEAPPTNARPQGLGSNQGFGCPSSDCSPSTCVPRSSPRLEPRTREPSSRLHSCWPACLPHPCSPLCPK